MHKRSDNKHILALDIGGTIEDTWSAKQSWFEKRGIDIGQKPIGRREVEAILGINKSLYQEMVDEVYSEEGIISHQLVVNSKKAIEKLHAHFEIVLLSTRPKNKREVTVKWLDNYGIFKFVSDIIFVNERGDVRDSKLETCYRLGGRIIVDDDIRHLTPASKFPSIQKFLFTANNISIFGIHAFQRWDTLPRKLEGIFFLLN